MAQSHVREIKSSEFTPQTPDRNKYHPAPGGAVMLPVGNHFQDGGHKAVDVTKDGVIVVEPGSGIGPIDMSKVTPEMMNRIVAGTADPLAIFRNLAQQAPAGPDTRIGDFVDKQPEIKEAAAPVTMGAEALPQVSGAVVVVEGPKPTPVARPEPVTVRPIAATPPVPSPIAYSTNARPASVAPAAPQPASGGVFGLGFLTDPPSIPTKRVYFNLHGVGTISANYHDVIVTDSVVVLVSDTASPFSAQYLPTASTQPFFVSYEGQELVPVIYLGICFQLGRMDVCVLCRENQSPEFVSGNENVVPPIM